jgi:hypothetical protein
MGTLNISSATAASVRDIEDVAFMVHSPLHHFPGIENSKNESMDQPENANDDEIDGNCITQQSRDDENQYSRNESNHRLWR